MTMNDKFLDIYKQLESELRSNGKSVLDYEESLTFDQTDKEKLKACRIMRNYMSHNDLEFMVASQAQIIFLKSITTKLRMSELTASNKMKKITPVKSNTSIKTVIVLLDKYGIVPLILNTGLYLVDKDIAIHQVALGNKTIETPGRLPTYKYIDKLTRMDSVKPGIYIVTDGGTNKDPYLGILSV